PPTGSGGARQTRCGGIRRPRRAARSPARPTAPPPRWSRAPRSPGRRWTASRTPLSSGGHSPSPYGRARPTQSMTTTSPAVAARALEAARAFRAPPDPATRTGFTPHPRPPAPIVGSVAFIALTRVGIGVGATLAVLVLITTAVVGVAWSQVPRDQLAV